MPRASDNAATAVNIGFFASIRSPKTISCRKPCIFYGRLNFLPGSNPPDLPMRLNGFSAHP
jgi:hypothetical protein